MIYSFCTRFLPVFWNCDKKSTGAIYGCAGTFIIVQLPLLWKWLLRSFYFIAIVAVCTVSSSSTAFAT